jgi:O-antigen biosynthesis protein
VAYDLGESLVRSAYRVLLGREAENDAVVAGLTERAAGDFDMILQSFITCREFHARFESHKNFLESFDITYSDDPRRVTNDHADPATGKSASESLVRSAYRVLLGREAENDAVVAGLRERAAGDFDMILQSFITCPEFHARFEGHKNFLVGFDFTYSDDPRRMTNDHADDPAAGKSASDIAGADGVIRIYNLMHRRDPESDTIVSDKCVKTIASIYSDSLNSREFYDSVVDPLVTNLPVWGPYRGSTSFSDLRRWAAAALPVGSDFWAKLDPNAGWEVFYLALLLDAKAQEINPMLAEPSIRSALQLRLCNAKRFVNRTVVGHVDYANFLEVGGWCGDEAGNGDHLIVEVFADNAFMGSVECDRYRPEIRALLGGGGSYGFSLKFSPRHLEFLQADRWISVRERVTQCFIGRILLRSSTVPEKFGQLGQVRQELERIKTILARIETEMPHHQRQFGFPILAYSEYFDAYLRETEERLAVYHDQLDALPTRPLVSVVLTVDTTNLKALDVSIQSIRRQVYPDWELRIIVRGAAALADSLASYLSRQAQIDSRIKPAVEESAVHAPNSTSLRPGYFLGDFVGFLRCGDRLSPDALLHVASAVQDGPVGLIYTDEDEFTIDENGAWIHQAPHFKPDFDLDLLFSQDYIGNFLLTRVSCLAEISPRDTVPFDAAHHDLTLRLVEQLRPEQIRHVPRVLYHRDATRDASVSVGANAREDSVGAVNAFFERNGIAATVEPHADPLGSAQPGACRIKWALPAAPPKVSIIIPTRDRRELLEPCVRSLTAISDEYPGEIELIIVDNDTTDPETRTLLTQIASRVGSRVLNFRGPFNWSALNNFASKQAKGEVLIFLNNDTLALSDGWCNELVSQASRHDVGAVGARLLYEDGTIQHGGVVIGVGRGLAAHEGVGEAVADGGYLGRSRLQRGISAVTGACLATRRAVFEQLRGFDEVNFSVTFNDIDYCMRVRQANLKVIYTPYATMYHYESKSRGIAIAGESKRSQDREEMNFRLRYKDCVNDPFYNPHFSRFEPPLTVLQPPRWCL